MSSFAKRLQVLRAKSALSQNELSQKSGVAAAQISRYEAGKNEPRGIVVQKLASALGVSYSSLAYGVEGQAVPVDTKSSHYVLNTLETFKAIYKPITVKEHLDDLMSGDERQDQLIRSIGFQLVKSFGELDSIYIDKPITEDSLIRGLTANGEEALTSLIKMMKENNQY